MIFTYDTEFKKGISLEINESGYPSFWEEEKRRLLDRLVSVFGAPASNKTLYKDLPIAKVLSMIKTGIYYKQTAELRTIADKTQNRLFKQSRFPFVCWSGTFGYHADENIVSHSGIVCIDLDHLGNDLARVQSLVNTDPYTVASFVSPNGDGLKVLCEVDTSFMPHTKWYLAHANRLVSLCALPTKKADSACSNVSRACFLPYDPSLYVNPTLS